MNQRIHPAKNCYGNENIQRLKNLEDWIDVMNTEFQKERAKTQMTLGKMIDQLSTMPEAKEIQGFSNPHSYRGYYQDIAFESSEKTTAGSALEMCRNCIGGIFIGYKGGDFQMGRHTPIWLASYGCSGQKIIGIRDDGTFELDDDEDDK